MSTVYTFIQFIMLENCGAAAPLLSSSIDGNSTFANLLRKFPSENNDFIHTINLPRPGRIRLLEFMMDSVK